MVCVESVSTVGRAVSFHEEGLVTTRTAASNPVTQHTVGRARFANLRGGFQEVVPATFQHTLTLQGGVGRLAHMALSWTLTLSAVIITAEAFVPVSIEASGAPLGAQSILQHMSLHAQQAVCPQRTFTGVAAPVALSAGPGAGVEVVLMGAAVILALSEQQHLGRVAAGRTHTGHVARQALAVTHLTDLVTIVIVTERTFWSAETRGQQNAAGRAGRTEERPRPTAAITR